MANDQSQDKCNQSKEEASTSDTQSLFSQTMPLKFGAIRHKQELLCFRCGRSELFVLPKTYIDTLDYPLREPDEVVHTWARQKGWISKKLSPLQKVHFYMLCPDCVQNDIDSFCRFVSYYRDNDPDHSV